MSVKTMKRDIREHSRQLERQKINLTYGTMRSVTTNGTLIRPIPDPFTETSTSNTRAEARWS